MRWQLPARLCRSSLGLPAWRWTPSNGRSGRGSCNARPILRPSLAFTTAETSAGSTTTVVATVNHDVLDINCIPGWPSRPVIPVCCLSGEYGSHEVNQVTVDSRFSNRCRSARCSSALRRPSLQMRPLRQHSARWRCMHQRARDERQQDGRQHQRQHRRSTCRIASCIRTRRRPTLRAAGGSSNVTARSGRGRRRDPAVEQLARSILPALFAGDRRSVRQCNAGSDPDEMRGPELCSGTPNSTRSPAVRTVSVSGIGSNKALTAPANSVPFTSMEAMSILQGDFQLHGLHDCSHEQRPTSNARSAQLRSNAQATKSTSPRRRAAHSKVSRSIRIVVRRDSNAGNKINGDSGTIIHGALYFPKQQLWYNGGGHDQRDLHDVRCPARRSSPATAAIPTSSRRLRDCAADGLPSRRRRNADGEAGGMMLHRSARDWPRTIAVRPSSRWR